MYSILDIIFHLDSLYILTINHLHFYLNIITSAFYKLRFDLVKFVEIS